MARQPPASCRPQKREVYILSIEYIHPIERPKLTLKFHSKPQEADNMPRGRRSAAQPAASVDAAATSLDSAGKRSIRLTVKAPPSRLREVTSRDSREQLGRSSRRKPIVEKSESEDEEERADEVAEDEDDVDEDEEAGGDEEDEEDGEEDEDGEEEDEEDEEEEDDEDEDMEDVSAMPPPKIKINGPPLTSRKPPPESALKNANVKSVEEKEMEDGSSDDELSSEPPEDEDEDMGDDGLNDDTINSAAIGEDELGSDEDDDFSRSGTPDPTKLTRRQRGTEEDSLLALSNEAQKKKFFTAEQITMRRAEMARRRKDLSEKRNRDEKEDTLRRLLHKPAPKRRSRAQMMADAEREEFGTPGAGDGEEAKANKLYIRTVMRMNGTMVGVPEEWLDSPIGKVFNGSRKVAGVITPRQYPRMVEELD